MRYSTESKNRIYVKRYRLLSLVKKIVNTKHISNKYSLKLFDGVTKFTTDAIKTALK